MPSQDLENPKENGAQKKKSAGVGRPKKYDIEQTVKRRNMTVTDLGWNTLDKIAKNNGLNSRSELIEQIGRRNLNVTSSNLIENTSLVSIEEIPILPRLLALIRKTAYVKSLLSFSRLVALKTGITENRYDKPEIIEEAFIKAIIIVALRNYIYPDRSVTSALADIRWLVFRLLSKSIGTDQEGLIKSKKELYEYIQSNNNNLVLKSSQYENKDKDKELDTKTRMILDSIYLLSKNYPSQYQIYKMRMMEGLTWHQIDRLLVLRGSKLTEEEIRNENHRAVAAIREIWHDLNKEMQRRTKNESNNEKTYSKTTTDEEILNLFEYLKDSLLIAEEYYSTVYSSVLDTEGIKKWESFLLIAMDNPKFDLLLPEIHHVWSHDNQYDMAIYANDQDKIIDDINKKFMGQLAENITLFKGKLKLCGIEKQDIQNTLMNFIHDNFDVDIPKDIFLGRAAM